jgi:DNA polymerase-3 subunit delta
VKLPPARLAGFLRSPDPPIRTALIYGPDAGLVAERADKLAAAICPDLRDPFRVAELDAASLAGDPARLYDEAASLSLSGGRRLLRLREAGDQVGAMFAAFLKALPPGDGFVLVEAGDLPSRSSLRRAFEAAKEAVAIACYADGPREIEELAREVLGARKISLTPDAMQYLVANLGGDRQVSRQELEKLALYAGDGGRVDEPAAAANVGDTAVASIDDVVFAASDGEAAPLDRALTRAFQEGEQPVTVLRALMRHFQRLYLVGSRKAQGMSEEDALRGLRPPVFFKLVDRFKRQLALWPPARAAAALEMLLEAECQAKTTGLPSDTICRAAALRIARGAAGRRARRG